MNGTAAPGALYIGRVFHARHRPHAHTFSYRVFSLLLDIDRIGEAAGATRFFSYNRRNILSFYDRDHGDHSGRPLRGWVDERLAEAGVEGIERVELLCFPRLLGYAFNPLSVYFCKDRADRLSALIYEVRNTFGEQHSYVAPLAEPSAYAPAEHGAGKVFYVSPFISMDAAYRFRVRAPGDRLNLLIEETEKGAPLLTASHHARRRPLTDRALLKALGGQPLMTAKVMAAIHWEALHLFTRKRAPFHMRPPYPEKTATILPPQ